MIEGFKKFIKIVLNQQYKNADKSVIYKMQMSQLRKGKYKLPHYIPIEGVRHDKYYYSE